MKIGGKNIINLRHADDTALIVESAQRIGSATNCGCSQIRNFKERFINEYREDKTMVINRDPEIRKININVYGSTLEQAETFKYLGQTIKSDGRSETEISFLLQLTKH